MSRADRLLAQARPLLEEALARVQRSRYELMRMQQRPGGPAN
ncbi:MAG: hypothetical protein U1F49_14440 [Rubrivivax sp.]